VGDPVYHPRKLLKNISKTFPTIPANIADVVKSARRQMLHAWRLGFIHPETGEKMQFEAPLAKDMSELLFKIRSLES
jgi:23S rRNA pseudouridine1911/1915/1917 synthase